MEGKNKQAAHKFTDFLANHVALKQSSDATIYVEAQERLGLALFELKRYTDAIAPLEAALAETGVGENRRKLCFHIGVCQLESGNLQAAEEKLTESLPADPHEELWAQAQYYLGCVYYGNGAYFKAIKTFETCECFMDGADAEWRESVSGWLAASRRQVTGK